MPARERLRLVEATIEARKAASIARHLPVTTARLRVPAVAFAAFVALYCFMQIPMRATPRMGLVAMEVAFLAALVAVVMYATILIPARLQLIAAGARIVIGSKFLHEIWVRTEPGVNALSGWADGEALSAFFTTLANNRWAFLAWIVFTIGIEPDAYVGSMPSMTTVLVALFSALLALAGWLQRHLTAGVLERAGGRRRTPAPRSQRVTANRQDSTMTTDTAHDVDGGADLRHLTVESCLALLATRSVGRLAVDDGRGPTILPVNYRLERGAIVVRTSAGTKLDAAQQRARVAFEVDDVDEATGTGWSVVVRGRLVEMLDPYDRDQVLATPPMPFAAGARDHVVALLSSGISGRMLVPRHVSPRHGRHVDTNTWSGRDGDDLLA